MAKHYVIILTESERDAIAGLLPAIVENPGDYAPGLAAKCTRVRRKLSAATAEEGTGRPRLTRRILEGILDSTSVHEAGGAEDLTGESSPESEKKYERVCDAFAWARQMRDWLDAGRKR
jgi:hypothetical protein